jgi:hypothetical protein
VTAGLLLAASLAAGAAWCLAFAAAGARIRRILRLPIPPALRLPIDLLVGGWIVAAALLALGLAGAFRPAAILGVTLLLAALGRWRRNGWRFRPALAVSAPVLLLLPVTLAPPFFYDALVYHLGLPWQALLDGRISPHPENVFATFPPLAQMIFAGPLAIGLDRIPALLHLASFIAAATVVAALARRLGAPRWMAILGGTAVPILPAVALVPALAAAEGWLIAPVAAAAALVLWRGRGRGNGRSGIDRASAILAGLLCGAACAARLQGIAWSGIVLALLVVRSRARLRDTLLAAAAWLAGSAPWWVKNAILLGEPLAPIGWRREGMETLWRDAGSRVHLAWSASESLGALWVAIEPHLAYAGPLILAALLAIAASSQRRAGSVEGRTAWLGLGALAGTIAWAATGNLARFLAPVLALVLVLAAASGRTRIGRWAGGLALASAVTLGAVFTWQQMSRWGGLALPFEAETSGMRGAVTNNPMPAFAAARDLPPDAKVLFVGEARVYRFPRRFVAPSQHDVSPLRDPLESMTTPREIQVWLASRGYTHLLVNASELARLAPMYPVAPFRTDAGRRRFQDLLDLLGPPVIRDGEVAVFRL